MNAKLQKLQDFLVFAWTGRQFNDGEDHVLTNLAVSGGRRASWRAERPATKIPAEPGSALPD